MMNLLFCCKVILKIHELNFSDRWYILTWALASFLNESWSVYSPAEKDEVDKYISSRWILFLIYIIFQSLHPLYFVNEHDQASCVENVERKY